MRLYLIGMPGCGKSRTARELANKLRLRLFDIDKDIEAHYGSINDLFAQKGESYFRDLETNYLRQSAKMNDVVISCGGGIIVRDINKEIMNKNGIIIFLNTPLDIIKEHLASNESRPLLKTNSIEELYQARIDKYYHFADYIIDYTDSEDACNKIEKLLKEPLRKKKILVINGPNLDMLGLRDKNHYGVKTLNEINKMMENHGCFKYEFFQSNYEGAIIDKLHTYKQYVAIIINPAAYTHTSVAIHDALEIVDIPKVEVHLSDVDNRDDFRKINFITSVVDYKISGLHEASYIAAINYLKRKLNVL